MSKESAVLLAQVIPVLALALGLEIRHLMSSATFREVRSGFDLLPHSNILPRNFGTWIAIICSACFLVLALLLAVAEVYALDVVAGRRPTPFGDWMSNFGPNRVAEWINLAIVFTFTAAPMTALYKTFSVPVLSRRPEYLVALAPSFPLVTFCCYLGLRALFWLTLN